MSIKTLTAKILKLMPDIGKCQFKFLVDFFCLIVACRGRVNFCNLARQGAYGEGAYRRHFGKDFDFLGFGRRLVENFCGGGACPLPSTLVFFAKAAGTRMVWVIFGRVAPGGGAKGFGNRGHRCA